MVPSMPQGYETENEQSIATQEADFSAVEMERLSAMRDRYSEHHDLFTDRELARLRFVRWMVQTGRLEA